jgi:hypothetical protein
VSTPTTGQTPAGWYLDPRTPGRTRWWDGSQWTSQLQPIAPVEERAQPTAARAWRPAPDDVPVVEPHQPYWSESPQAVLASRVSRGGAGLGARTYHAHRGQITISVTVLGTTATMLGTVHGNTLTLNIPNDDGTLSPVILTRTTPAGWAERLGAWVTETFSSAGDRARPLSLVPGYRPVGLGAG